MSGDNEMSGLRLRALTEDRGEDDPAPAPVWRLLHRLRSWAATVWATVRPNRDRSTGYIAVGLAGALVSTSVVVGIGTSSSVPDLADIGAWLSSSEKGTASHANGLTGDVDGRVELPTGKHPVSISQDGTTVLVLDKKTGRVVRVDPAQLTAEQSTTYSSSDLQLVAGGAFAYLVNPVKGTVQRIDPVRTTPIGTAVDVGAKPLGRAVVDPKGTLWVPLPTRGEVIPFPDGARGEALTGLAEPGSNLELTLANGTTVATDTTGGTLTVLGPQEPELRVKLPSYIDQASPETVLVPAASSTDVVPVLAAQSGRMTLVDVRTAALTHATLGSGSGGRYGPPQVLGSKVYVPDRSNGSLQVYDTIQAAVLEPIRITGEPGELDLFVRDGLLWVNDQSSAAAAVINADGEVSRIGKYATEAPTDDGPATDHPPEPDPSRKPQPDPEPSDPPDPDPTKEPDPSPPAPRLPPGTPQAQAGPNGVTVTFAPSPGARPESYDLGIGHGDDALIPPYAYEASPRSVGSSGPFQFRVTGLPCSTPVNFQVVARFPDGKPALSQRSSEITPCVAPGSPRNVRVTVPKNGGKAAVRWDAPTHAGGDLKYEVSWDAKTGEQPSQRRETSDTSYTIEGLKNDTIYQVSVRSRNAAGSSAAVTTEADLTPPEHFRQITNVSLMDRAPVYSGPSSDTELVGSVSPDTAVAVQCRMAGTREVNEGNGKSSNIWARIHYEEGRSRWISDLYLEIADDPDVWRCE